jgi:DNA repair exonuclease SbcCD ATPase subunit
MSCNRHKDENIEGREICLFCEKERLESKIRNMTERSEMLEEQLSLALSQRDSIVENTNSLIEKASSLNDTMNEILRINDRSIHVSFVSPVVDVLKAWFAHSNVTECDSEDMKDLQEATSYSILLLERLMNEKKKG